MFLEFSMIRASRDFDWGRLLRDLIPDIVEVKHAGKTYFKVPRTKTVRDALVIQFLGDKICYHMPDARTVVFRTEADMKRLLERRPGELPARDWSGAWKAVERELAVVFLDNTGGQWSKQLDARTEPDKELFPYQKNVRWAVWGVNGKDDFVCTAQVECKSEKGSEKVAAAAEKDLAAAAKYLAGPDAQPENDSEKASLKFFLDLFQGARVRRDGKGVSLRFTAHVDFGALVTAFTKGELPL
jgi:hypothetical protein